ncbi:MAG: hypothetical protein KUG59_06200, partial [Parvibaculaceae bacterium]|nr:hypothetical protein [Parvibaculaceae bacterium]
MSNGYDFDVIVVGSGMSGGWAAKEFCEKGFKTLVLDRGKPLEHGDYSTENVAPWEMTNRGRANETEAERVLRMASYAREILQAGVTTIRSPGNSWPPI